MTKPEVYVESGDVTPTACPFCQAEITGATGTSFSGPADFNNRVGKPTVCVYCGAISIFADSSGRLRVPTPEESADIEASPDIMKIVGMVRGWITQKVSGKPG